MFNWKLSKKKYVIKYRFKFKTVMYFYFFLKEIKRDLLKKKKKKKY